MMSDTKEHNLVNKQNPQKLVQCPHIYICGQYGWGGSREKINKNDLIDGRLAR